MTTQSISINWPIPTGLTGSRIKLKNIRETRARFTWNKITETEMQALDPSGGGFVDLFWRVQLNNDKTFLVYNNPVFETVIPMGCCEMCVKVQAFYLVNNSGPTNILAVSEYSNEACVKCDPDPYCDSVRSRGNKTITQNAGSANMRYARALRLGGKNAFR